MLLGHKLITTKDAGDAVTLLQSLTGSTFDSSQLVLTACMGYLAVTEAKLQELRKKHRPAVLEIIEERSKGGNVWKDSKGLATRLYSFKHDRGALIKEADMDRSGDRLTDGNGFLETVNSEADVPAPDLKDEVAELFQQFQNIHAYFYTFFFQEEYMHFSQLKI